MPPRTSGLASWAVGQQSLYHPPVSTMSRLPSASSRTSVGRKSTSSEEDEIGVGGGVGRAVGAEGVAADLVEVEGGGEEVVLVGGAEGGGLIAAQAAGGTGTELDEGVEEVGTGPDDAAVFEHRVLLAVDAAVEGVGDAIAPTGLAEIDEGAGEEGFTVRGEGDFDRIVHAAGHDDLEVGAVGFGAEDMRGAVVDGGLARARVVLFGEGALGPIDVAIGA
jgi:hypothetical protein